MCMCEFGGRGAGRGGVGRAVGGAGQLVGRRLFTTGPVCCVCGAAVPLGEAPRLQLPHATELLWPSTRGVPARVGGCCGPRARGANGCAQQVAESFGMCSTLLKKICRRNGINRWPYRQVCVRARTRLRGHERKRRQWWVVLVRRFRASRRPSKN